MKHQNRKLMKTRKH